MARKSKPSLEGYQRKLKNGYGIGCGLDYKPWIGMSDLPSNGVVSQPFGLKTNRTHLCLSNHENNFLHLAEFDSDVIDIREQFPLFPIELAIRLSEELGIKYPLIPGTKTPNVITTDFLLTCKGSDNYLYKAYSVKPEDGLKTNRDFEKQELERAWWESLGIQWQIYTDSESDKIIAENIKWFSQPARNNIFFEVDILLRAIDAIEIGKRDISVVIRVLAKELNISEFEASNLFKVLVWEKKIEVDLGILIEMYGVVDILKVSNTSKQREVCYGFGA